MVERIRIQDPNATQQGNAPTTQKALGGVHQVNRGDIPRLSSGFRAGGIAGGIAGMSAASSAFKQKQEDEAYVEGQLAFMSGKSEDEVREEGNGTTMAGYVELGVQNGVSAWNNDIDASIPTDHFDTSPEDFQKHLASQTAALLEKVGPDPVARAAFAKSMSVRQAQLAAKHQVAYNEHVRQQTSNEYIESLTNSANENQSAEQANSPMVTTDENWKSQGSGYRGTVKAFAGKMASGSAQSGGYLKGVIKSIQGHEGFKTTAYWDVNAWRTGYGSDTYTTADGKVHKVLKSSVITRGDADRDIHRRMTKEFIPKVKRVIGEEGWNNASQGTKSALSSIAYNYGSLPKRIHAAAQSGDPAKLAAAVRKLGGDNNGINRGRRNREADMILAGGHTRGGGEWDHAHIGPQEDQTWTRLMETYRPDLASKLSNEELLEMRDNPTVANNMMNEYTAENARGLAKSNLPVNGATLVLANRLGLAATRKVLHRSDDTPLDSVLTKSELVKHKDLVASGSGYITVGDLKKKAHGQISDNTEYTNTNHEGLSTAARVLRNPGLSPADHKAAVVTAVINGFSGGDDALYSNMGGQQTLRRLGVSAAQIQAVERARKQYETERNNKYDAAYEDAKNDLYDNAKGKSEEEVRALREKFHTRWDRGDEAAKKIHRDLEKMADDEEDAAAKAILQEDPDVLLEINDINQDVKTGHASLEDGVERLTELQEMYGGDKAALATLIKNVIKISNDRDAALGGTIKSNAAAEKKKAEADAKAKAAIANNTLVTGTPTEVKHGIALQKAALAERIAKNDKIPDDQKEEALENGMAEFFVKQNIADAGTAVRARSAFLKPVVNGEVTEAARDAIEFHMRMKLDHEASADYFDHMYKDDKPTLNYIQDVIRLAEGSGDIDAAIMEATEYRDNAIKNEVYKTNLERVNTGETQTEVMEEILSSTGREDTIWNRMANVLNDTFDLTKLSDEQRETIMDKGNLRAVVDNAIATQLRLHPEAHPENIKERAVSQVRAHSTFLGGSLVTVQPNTPSIGKRMGLKSSKPGIENEALMKYLMAFGGNSYSPKAGEQQGFGPDVWKEIGPATGWARNRREEDRRPEVAVSLIGDTFVITPSAGMYTDLSSNPGGRKIVVAAKDVGEWFNNQKAPDTPLQNLLADGIKESFNNQDMARTGEGNSGAGRTPTEAVENIQPTEIQDMAKTGEGNSGAGETVQELLRKQGLID